MAVLCNDGLRAGAVALAAASSGSDDTYTIEKSVKIDEAAQSYLEKKFKGEGNRRTNTLSYWIKTTGLDESTNVITGGGEDGNNRSHSGFDNSNKFYRYELVGGSDVAEFTSDRLFFDPNAWYHIVEVIDTRNDLDTDRFRLYVNGRKESISYTTKFPQLQQGLRSADGKNLTFGVYYDQGAFNCNVMLADIHYVDGLALSPAAFGKVDSTGNWVAINPYDSDGKLKVPAPNDGTTWSSGGGESESFDGDISGSNGPLIGSGAFSTICADLDVTINQSLRIEGNWAGASATIIIELDGKEYSPTSTEGLWETFDQFIGKSISGTLKAKTSSGQAYLRAVEVDGVILVDGRTDATSGDNPNNGKIWSDIVPTASGFRSGKSAPMGFDGDLTDYVATNDTTLTLPIGNWNATGKLEVMSGNNHQWSVDGSTAANMAGDQKWTSVGNAEDITNLVLTRTDGSYPLVYGMKINGHLLVDHRVDHSFHLKFNDTTSDARLGRNSRNKGIEDSTVNGALPIHNTTAEDSGYDPGETKGSGYRADSSAGTTDGTGLLLAIPGDSFTKYSSFGDSHVDDAAAAFNGSTSGTYATAGAGTTGTFTFTGSKFTGITKLRLYCRYDSRDSASNAKLLVNGEDIEAGSSAGWVTATEHLDSGKLTTIQIKSGSYSTALWAVEIDDVILQNYDDGDIHGSINTGSSNNILTVDGTLLKKDDSRFYGSSLYFPASGNGILTPTQDDFDMSTSSLNFTIEAWVKVKEGSSGGDGWLTLGGGTDSSSSLIWYWQTDNTMKSYISSSSSSGWNIANGKDWKVPIGQWTHLALVRSGGNTIKAYTNGANVWTENAVSAGLYGDQNSFCIGRAQSSQHANGWMNDFRFYRGVAKYTSDFIPPSRIDVTPYKLKTASPVTTDKSVANATGAKPILETTDTYGHVTNGSERSDSVSQQLLFLPMNGTNNATTFTDVSNNNWSVSVNGNTKTVTNESKFYGSCAYFDGSGDYLQYADSGDWECDGNFTVEGWFKFAHAPDGTNETLIGTVGSGGGNHGFDLGRRRSNDSNNPSKIAFSWADDNIDWYYLYSDEGLTDDGWHHIAASIDSNTARLFIDGVQQGGTVTHGTGTGHNSPTPLTIGAEYHSSGRHPFQGWMQDVRIYGDGKYTSDFTVTNDPNLYPPENQDALTDSPTNGGSDTGKGGEVTGNFCTMSMIDKGSGITLSKGSLTVSTPSSSDNWDNRKCMGTMSMSGGKFYYEQTFDTYTASAYAGVIKYSPNSAASSLGAQATGYGVASSNGKKYNNGTNAPYGDSFGAGDTISVAFDGETGTLWFAKNGTWMNSATKSQIAAGTTSNAAWTGIDKDMKPGYSAYSETVVTFNFGQRLWKYPDSVPDGFKALCTQNLPDTFSGDELNNPRKYFDIVSYRGTGVARALGGLEFQPELVWGKTRSNATDHKMANVLVGTGKYLETNQARDIENDSNSYTSWNSDGFSIGTSGDVNTAGRTYVAWCWDAGTSAHTSDLDAGTIDISSGNQYVNQTAGFSITKFTGTGANATFSHGLNAAPEFIVIKNADANVDWAAGHVGMTMGAGRGKFNDNVALTSDYASSYWNSTAATNSLIHVGNEGIANTSGSDGMMCFAWTPIAGYSSFGKYSGRGSNHEIFVYTGFRPRWIMIKTHGTNRWNILDTRRDQYNPVNKFLWVDSSDDETVETSNQIMVLSNGFQLKGTAAATNADGTTYIYSCFAEHPFKTARAF